MATLPSTKELDPYELAIGSSHSSYFPTLPQWANVFHRFSKWREVLDLPNPGTVENLQKEVKTTQLTNFAFDGGRADLTKSLSMNPAFQVTHSFALGSQTATPSYNFGAVYMTPKIFLQGSVDHDGNVNARLNQGWTPNHITKVQGQFSYQAGHNLIQVDHDYLGRDYSLNAKAVNPWPTDLTGVYIGSYFQSITKNLAVGVESVYQHPTPDVAELAFSYLAKLTGSQKNWIGTAHIQPNSLTATYWQKLSEKVEVAAEMQVVSMPTRRDAVATLGAKYDLRMATFRAQVDSTGKVSALLEQRFLPTFAFLVSGELDHFRNSSKFGVGLMLESSSMTMEEMEAMGMGPPHPPP